jgi:hypothetical protein
VQDENQKKSASSKKRKVLIKEEDDATPKPSNGVSRLIAKRKSS